MNTRIGVVGRILIALLIGVAPTSAQARSTFEISAISKQTLVFPAREPIVDYPLVVLAGDARRPSYSISPSLPSGIVLASQTGLLSGTPVSPSPAREYVLSVRAGGVTQSVNISISVDGDRTLALDPRFGQLGISQWDLQLLATERVKSSRRTKQSAMASAIEGVQYEAWVNVTAVQPDGKIVVAAEVDVPHLDRSLDPTSGDILLTRFNLDGSLDKTFGDQGVARLDVRGTPETPTAIGFMADGRIVVGGLIINADWTSMEMLVARYTPRGLLDRTFNGTGIVTGGPEQAPGTVRRVDVRTLSVLSGGRIALGGLDFSCPLGEECPWASLTARLLSDGTWDPSFGENGFARFSPADFIDRGVTGLSLIPSAVAENGSQLLSGWVVGLDGQSTQVGAVIRLLPDGSLDDMFGVDGLVELPMIAALRSRIDTQGRIVVLGQGSSSITQQSVFTRLLPDGQIDITFGTDGTTTYLIDRCVLTAFSFAGDSIFATGMVYFGNVDNKGYFGVWRLTADGVPDDAIAEDGRIVIEIGDFEDRPLDIAVLTDGRILVTGLTVTTLDGESSEFVMALLTFT